MTTTEATLAPPRIGQLWPEQGGLYMGIMAGGTAPDGSPRPDYHLIVAAAPDGEMRDVAWGGYDQDEPGATSWNDGQANTRALCASKHKHPAAQHCAAAEVEGHADWYLPALGELKLCFANGREHFSHEHWYWSSTQCSRSSAYVQAFRGGGTYWGGKDGGDCTARLVRRFDLTT